jgi:hypothetical protein
MSQKTHPSAIGARSDILLAKRLPPKQKVFLMARPPAGWFGIRWEWDSARRGVDLTDSTATLPDAAAGSGSGMPPSCRSSESKASFGFAVCVIPWPRMCSRFGS